MPLGNLVIRRALEAPFCVTQSSSTPIYLHRALSNQELKLQPLVAFLTHQELFLATGIVPRNSNNRSLPADATETSERFLTPKNSVVRVDHAGNGQACGRDDAATIGLPGGLVNGKRQTGPAIPRSHPAETREPAVLRSRAAGTGGSC